ncbi:MAG: hypothetical protein ABIJ09_22325 [Pseudomonadota bacterium]
MRSPRRSCAWVLGFALAIACSGVGACARERAKSEAKQRVFAPPPPPAEQLLAQQPLDASALARDPAVRDRILHMTLGELALRLGSAQFRGEESVTFSRGDLKRKQVTRARVRQNKAGSFAVDVEMEGGDQQPSSTTMACCTCGTTWATGAPAATRPRNGCAGASRPTACGPPSRILSAAACGCPRDDPCSIRVATPCALIS